MKDMLLNCKGISWDEYPEFFKYGTYVKRILYMKPGENGESPLAKLDSWINTTCPKCGKPAKRETDTMPQWAGSSWYYLRYMDPHNDKALASKEALEYYDKLGWIAMTDNYFQVQKDKLINICYELRKLRWENQGV